MNGPRIVAALAVLGALGAAHAQDGEDPARKLLRGLAPKDPRVTGRSFFGVHVGRRNVGTLEVDVAPTTSGSSSYHARARAQAAVEDERVELEEDGLLERRLSPALLDERELEGPRDGKGGPPPLVRRVTRSGETFSLWRPGGETGRTTPVASALPLVHGLAARFALLRALDARTRATYRVSDVDPETGAVREVEVEVRGEAAEKRAEGPTLFPVVVRVGGAGEAWRFLLDPEAPPARRVASFARTDREVLTFVLAPDAAGARKDLPPPPRPPAGSPRAAILDYLEAVERRDAKKLEPLLDWPSLQRALGDRGGLDEWKKGFLEHFATHEDDDDHGSHASALDLIPRLVEEPFGADALDARVRIEGEKGVFRLIRDAAGKPWRISELP